MARRHAKTTAAELRLLKALWDQAPLTARELTERLYGGTSVSEIATVQALLQRLENKRLVSRDRSQHVHRFAPAVTRAAFAGGQLEEMADQLTEGSLMPFLIHLVRGKRMSLAEQAELRQLLDEQLKKR